MPAARSHDDIPMARALSVPLLALLVFASGVAMADASVLGERELEGRLFAPCCWIQTLDVHESPLADTLRTEIHDRLHAGERSTQIEADLVSRYGAKILAVPTGRDPRQHIVWITLAAMSLVLIGLFVAARRWARGSTDALPPAAASVAAVGASDAIDARIEAELDKLRA
jgi:cytochrome c-type biogenesis protein CcmH